MSDIWTIIWKEWKDLFGSGERSDWLRPLWIVVIMGIVLPLSSRLRWIDLAPGTILLTMIIPFLLITTFIADAIAGERERHTLETLLASRISDRAILLGKVLMTVAFSWGLSVISLLLGALVVNLVAGRERWVFYSPISLFLVVLVLSLLTTLLAASGGVLISLKSATVRQAAQTMVLGELLLGLAVYGVVRVLPASLFASLTTSQLVLVVMGALAVLDAILLGAALASFRRSRLIAG